MKLVRLLASFLGAGTIAYTVMMMGSDLFAFLLPLALVSAVVVLVGSAVLSIKQLKLSNVLVVYCAVAVASLLAIIMSDPGTTGAAMLLLFLVLGAVLALRASYLSTRRRKYGLSSYYG